MIVKFSEGAKNDLREIRFFLRLTSRGRNYEKKLNSIFDEIENLKLPVIHRCLDEGIYRKIFDEYIILYDKTDTSILIHSVLHQKQNY